MNSTVSLKPDYGVYKNKLVTYARICTSKVDFVDRLRRLSSRLNQQGFKSTLLLKSLNKFFKRHGVYHQISNYTAGVETGNQWLNGPAIYILYLKRILYSFNPFITLSVSVGCVHARYLNMRALSFIT